MTTTMDWKIVEEKTGNSSVTSLQCNTSCDNFVTSPDSVNRGNASCSPPLKRPRLDDATRPEEVSDSPTLSDTSDPVEECSAEEYLAYCLSFVENFKFIKTRTIGPRDIQEYAELALAQYKQDTGLDYDFTRERSWSPFPFPDGHKGTHFNFYARLKGCESNAQEELFYAELDHCGNKVYNCCILPSKQDGGYLTFMLHPEHINCEGCADGTKGLGAWVMDVDESNARAICG